jgi:hypothetical protein
VSRPGRCLHNDLGVCADLHLRGFSNYVAVPDYQKSAVSSYLENYAPSYPYYTYQNLSSIQSSDGVYNRGGRGIPDVSANGELNASNMSTLLY